MNYLEQILQYSEWNNWFIIFVCLICAFKFLVDLYDWACKRFGWDNKRLKKVNTLNKHERDIEEVKEQLQKVVGKVNTMAQMIIEMQERSDATERARIKDRIAQSYHYYHKKQEWTKMEKEAFNDLILDYEAHSGSNSFVHSICEPESYTWRVID